MPNISHKPPPEQAHLLAEFIRQSLTEKQISSRTAARQIGIDDALLCRILNGTHTPSARVCNLIADYFHVPRVQVYAMSGWLEINAPNNSQAIETLRSSISEDDFLEAEQIFYNIGDQIARDQFVKLLHRLRDELQTHYPGPLDFPE